MGIAEDSAVQQVCVFSNLRVGVHAGARVIEIHLAMGVEPAVGQGAVRLTVGRFTTEDEVNRAGEILVRAACG